MHRGELFMKKIFVVLLARAVLVSGCSIVFDGDNVDLDVVLYEGSSGYSLNVPNTWVMDEETDNTVSFRVGALDPPGWVRRVSGAQAPANPRSEHS